MEKLLSMLVRCLIYTIIFYQKNISCFMNRRCLFYPTCSEYAIRSFESKGLIKGFILIIYRLLKCHPYNKFLKFF